MKFRSLDGKMDFQLTTSASTFPCFQINWILPPYDVSNHVSSWKIRTLAQIYILLSGSVFTWRCFDDILTHNVRESSVQEIFSQNGRVFYIHLWFLEEHGVLQMSSHVHCLELSVCFCCLINYYSYQTMYESIPNQPTDNVASAKK